MKPTRRQFVNSGAGLAVSPALSAAAGTSGARLSGGYSPQSLSGILIARGEWKPFPPAADRSSWQALPPERSAPLVEAGARHLQAAWPELPATVFLEFQRTGNRSRYEALQFGRRDRLRQMALAECVEGKARFLDDIVNGIWATCEETFWGVPAHLGMQRAGAGLPDAAEPIVDLFAAETAALLAWTDYLLGPALDQVSPLVRPRIRLEVERRLLEPCRTRNDFWWMGLDSEKNRSLNNWTPWIDSNWLTCSLLFEDDPRRGASAHRILRSLDSFLEGYHEDGGCDEGPSYWGRAGGSLFDCLDLFHSASAGRMDFFSVPLVREIGRYIYRAHIHDGYFVNFADSPAKPHVPGGLVFQYGARIGDEKMQGLGAFLQRRSETSDESIGRQLRTLFDSRLASARPFQPLLRDVWMPGLQVMAARVKEESAEGLYLAAKGGHNAESHNHNDVGNFVVYAGGEPAIVDVGVETYSAKTFSAQRYEIWTMQSAYHNLPTIGGVMQPEGRRFAAREVEHQADANAAELRMDIAAAYPAEAGLVSWRRTLRLERAANRVVVEDRYALKKAVPHIVLTLMTPCRSEVSSGEVALALAGSGRVRVLFDANALAAKVEEIPITDQTLGHAWGPMLYRLQLTAVNPPREGAFTVRIEQRAR
ncbi:MAG TPA: heparinase II/III family protein [Bryobacteraceae bacterium]